MRERLWQWVARWVCPPHAVTWPTIPTMSTEREKAEERAEMQVEAIWWLIKAIVVTSVIIAIWQYLT